MPDVNLSLDLGSLFVDSVQPDGDPVDLRTAMREAVVKKAAQKLIAGFDHEELHELRQEVQRVRSDLVRERLTAEVNAAFDEPVQRMSQWGEKRGDVTSVRELIRLELEAFLNGTHTNRRRDSHDKTPNNLAELIGQVANETMRGELGTVVLAARKEVNKRVQEIITKNVAAELVKPR